MTMDPTIKQLEKERGDVTHQISNRQKEITRLTRQLKKSLMPNQKSLLQAQLARQIRMLDVDQRALVNLDTSLAAKADTL